MTPTSDAGDARRTTGEVLRFLVAGVVNTGVGYGIYAACIALGMNLFAAQATGHVLGTLFNYVVHQRFVFSGQSSLWRYAATSGLNYVAGLVLLFLVSRVIVNAYWAGLVAVGLQAVFSYVTLKFLAFRRPAPASGSGQG